MNADAARLLLARDHFRDVQRVVFHAAVEDASQIVSLSQITNPFSTKSLLDDGNSLFA